MRRTLIVFGLVVLALVLWLFFASSPNNASIDRSCVVDDDCTIVPPLECGLCAINHAADDVLAVNEAALETRYTRFVWLRCFGGVRSCIPARQSIQIVPVCESGRCVKHDRGIDGLRDTWFPTSFSLSSFAYDPGDPIYVGYKNEYGVERIRDVRCNGESVPFTLNGSLIVPDGAYGYAKLLIDVPPTGHECEIVTQRGTTPIFTIRNI